LCEPTDSTTANDTLAENDQAYDEEHDAREPGQYHDAGAGVHEDNCPSSGSAAAAHPYRMVIPVKKPADGELTVDQAAYNAVHGALRCLGERANSLLKTTFKALRRWRGCPWRIGQVVAASLVVLHHEHHRTT